MSPSGAIVQTGHFIASQRGGRRFRLVTEPEAREPRGTVVFVHAFGEEMNKSRRMAARMARLLAEAGWRVVQRDLAGCGDSSGEFGDATWDDWLADVHDEAAAAIAQRPLWLWGQRAGALLATAVASRVRGCHLLLWQPVVSGAQHLQQFLRLHAGARIAGTGTAPAGQSPAQRLRAGEAVEVGGYCVHPALASGLEQAKLEWPAGFDGRIVWLELSTMAPLQLSAASTRCIAEWTERGATVEADVLNGSPFWQTQEIEESDALLQRTAERVAGDIGVAPQTPLASAEPRHRAERGVVS
jgi:exosortase A-associated hydrolase 2